MPIKINSVSGRKIVAVINSDDGEFKSHPVEYIHNPDHIFNFELKFGAKKKQTLLVFDPYGNEVISSRMWKRLFGSNKYKETIGILKETREIVRVWFNCEEHNVRLTYAGFDFSYDYMHREDCNGLFFPLRHMDQLQSLLKAKRPFSVMINQSLLHSFFDQEIGLDALRNSIEISFHFGRGKECRVVSCNTSYDIAYVDDCDVEK